MQLSSIINLHLHCRAFTKFVLNLNACAQCCLSAIWFFWWVGVFISAYNMYYLLAILHVYISVDAFGQIQSYFISHCSISYIIIYYFISFNYTYHVVVDMIILHALTEKRTYPFSWRNIPRMSAWKHQARPLWFSSIWEFVPWRHWCHVQFHAILVFNS